jgi:hypothetical protein
MFALPQTSANPVEVSDLLNQLAHFHSIDSTAEVYAEDGVIYVTFFAENYQPDERDVCTDVSINGQWVHYTDVNFEEVDFSGTEFYRYILAV